jgi:hypothetical protein
VKGTAFPFVRRYLLKDGFADPQDTPDNIQLFALFRRDDVGRVERFVIADDLDTV